MSKYLKHIAMVAMAIALATPMSNADAASVATPDDLLAMTELLGPLTRPSSSRHVCGESPYRLSIGAAGGLLAGLASGAATGALVGSKCDLALLGMTFSLCTIIGAGVGAAFGVIVSTNTADLVNGWRDCSGMLYLTPHNEIAMQLDGDSHLETLDIAARRNARVMALFDDYINRCGAAAWYTPRKVADAGKPFVGIGSTATEAESVAVRSCQRIMGTEQRCKVILPGACNSWR